MSKPEKIPATRLSGLLFSISLILIVSPAFILLLMRVSNSAPSMLQVLSLIPFVAGIALYLLLRFRKVI